MTRRFTYNLLTALPLAATLAFGLSLWQSNGALLNSRPSLPSGFDLSGAFTVYPAYAAGCDPTGNPPAPPAGSGAIYYNNCSSVKSFRVYADPAKGWVDLTAGGGVLWTAYAAPNDKNIYNTSESTGTASVGGGIIAGVTQNLGSATVDPNAIALGANQNTYYGLALTSSDGSAPTSDSSANLLLLQTFTPGATGGTNGGGAYTNRFVVDTAGNVTVGSNLSVAYQTSTTSLCLSGDCRTDWNGKGGGPSTADKLWAPTGDSSPDIYNTNLGAVVVGGNLELQGSSPPQNQSAVALPPDTFASGDINSMWGTVTTNGVVVYTVGTRSGTLENDRFAINVYKNGKWTSAEAFTGDGSSAGSLNTVWGTKDGSHVFAAGGGGLLVEQTNTLLGTVQWVPTDISTGSITALTGTPGGEAVYAGASNSPNQFLYRALKPTSGSGYSWASIGTLAVSNAITAMAINDTGTVLYVAQGANMTRCTSASGFVSSTNQCTSEGVSGGWSTINGLWESPDGTLVIATSINGKIYRKVGTTWTVSTTSSSTNYQIWGTKMSNGSYELWTVGIGGSLLASVDNGAASPVPTWSQPASLPGTYSNTSLKTVFFNLNADDSLGVLFAAASLNGTMFELAPSLGFPTPTLIANGYAVRLNAVWTANDSYAVGMAVGEKSRAILYNGTWSTVISRDTFKVGGTYTNLNAVWGTNSATPTVWVGGDGGLLVKFTLPNQTGTTLTTPSGSNINALWATASGNHLFINSGNSVYHSTNGGTSWTDITNTGVCGNGTPRYLWGTEDGAGNYKLYGLFSLSPCVYNGTSWTPLGGSFGGTGSAAGIWASQDNTHVYALTSSTLQASLYSYSGGSWSAATTIPFSIHTGGNGGINHIYGSADGKIVVIAGDNGNYVQWDATASTMPVYPTNYQFWGVSNWYTVGGSDAFVYVLGNDQHMLKIPTSLGTLTGYLIMSKADLLITNGDVRINRGDLSVPNNKWGTNNSGNGPLPTSPAAAVPTGQAISTSAVGGTHYIAPSLGGLFTCLQGQYVIGLWINGSTITGVQCDSL